MNDDQNQPTENISDSCLNVVTQDLWADDDRKVIDRIKAIVRNEYLLAQTVAECEKNVEDFEKSKKGDIHSTMDANVWTDEFLKTFQYANLDRESVHSWVCNMIMVGYDHALSRRNKDHIYILKSHTGAIVTVFPWEPSVKEMDQAYAKHLNQDQLQPGASEWNCILYRWSRNDGLQVWNGKIELDTKYKWTIFDT